MGTNSQTFGQHEQLMLIVTQMMNGTYHFCIIIIHFWNPAWGGDLRLYDSFQEVYRLREEHVKEHCIGSIEFVPNRLLIFDGRIHAADAPDEKMQDMQIDVQ